jgi:hypothetical protein
MANTFSRTRSLNPSRRYDQALFTDLVRQLREAGFTIVSVVLPHNLSGRGIGGSEISPEEFIQDGRNYPAIILRAQAPASNETIKVFFINTNSNAYFTDPTYPAATYGLPSLHVESPDPARAYALSQYFHERLSGGTHSWFLLLAVLSVIGMLLLFVEIAAAIGRGTGLLLHLFGWPGWTDILFSIATAGWLLYFFALPKGLLIAPAHADRLLASMGRIAKGDVKDNPLIQLAVTILGGVIVALILKWLGWI